MLSCPRLSVSTFVFPYFLTTTNTGPAVQKPLAETLAAELNQPNFVELIQKFLRKQLYGDAESLLSDEDTTDPSLPFFNGRVEVHSSALATFRAPSDISGVGGMRREHIRATQSWRNGPPRYDCVFVNTDPAAEGMRGLDVARVFLFFSINFHGTKYPCALVHWMSRLGNEPDEDTGMWIVQPDVNADGSPTMSVIHLDCILRAAHLIGVYGTALLPDNLDFYQSLDAFRSFYVNKFVDYHSFEIAF